ncbi:uncharacterized protein LOC144943319 [Lampetra fluviatilis]
MDIPVLNGAAGLPSAEQVLDPRVLQSPEIARPVPQPGPLLFTEEAPLRSSVVGPGPATELREKAGSLPACCETTSMDGSKARVAQLSRTASSSSDSSTDSSSSASNSEDSAEERESDSSSEAGSEDQFLPAAPRVHLASSSSFSSSSVLSMICCF